MAITSGFFNAKVDSEGNYDRAGTAEQFAKYFSMLVGNGIFPNPSTGFQVVAQTGMNLSVKAGYAWINGYWANLDVDDYVSIESSPTSNSRIDRVVLQLDLTQSARTVSLVVKKGVESTTPVAPELTRNNEVYELALADVTVGANVSYITQANINDRRLDSNLCGIVTGLIDQVDTSTLYNQIQADLDNFQTMSEADFNTWLASIQGILDEDTAGHLLTLVQNLQEEVENHLWQTVTIADGEATITVTDNKTRFKVEPEDGWILSVTCDDGDAFVLWITDDSYSITFDDDIEIVGELDQDGSERLITFIRTGDVIRGYVLGKD